MWQNHEWVMNLPQRPSCDHRQASPDEEKAVIWGWCPTWISVHTAFGPASLQSGFGDAAGDWDQPNGSSGCGKGGLIPWWETHQGKVPGGTSTTGFVWWGACGVAGCWGRQQGDHACPAVESQLCWSQAVLLLISAELGFQRWWYTLLS